jgi:YbbR domain-containing protein
MIRFLRKYVFHNFALKLISLVAAVLLWMAVARDPNAEVAVTVPIEFQHVPDNLEISTEKIPEAQIRVRGPGRMLRSLAQSEVHATIDLVGARPGERTYDLTGPQIIRVPREVEVVQVVPAQLHLSFDRRGRKEVPITPRMIDLYGAGPRTVVRVEPATALLVGPEKHVQNIDAALTDVIDAGGVASGTFSGIHIYVTDPLVRVARPMSVNVTVASGAEGRPAHNPSADLH